jgi:hypothetical protein
MQQLTVIDKTESSRQQQCVSFHKFHSKF